MKKGIGWWYWTLTVLLAAGVSGWTAGLGLAIAMCGLQLIHFVWRESSLTAFSVQVRLGYLVLLLLGLWGPLQFIHWSQLIGTTAMVLFDYCFLARVLSLLPWNRTGPSSWALLRRTFLSPPVRGNILQGLPAE